MYGTRLISAGIAVIGLALGPASAGTQPSKEASPSDRAFFQKRLAESKQEVAALASDIDGLIKALQDAKTSRDESRMKTAMDASLLHLDKMKAKAEKCRKMMEGMEEKHKEMKMGMKKEEPAEPKAEEGAKSPEGGSHEGHHPKQ